MNPVNLALNLIGFGLDVSPWGASFRNVTFYDQETQRRLFSNALDARDDNPVWKALNYIEELPYFHSAVIDCNVGIESRLCRHPLETGEVVADHKIIDPKKFEIELVMPNFLFGNVIQELNDYFKNSKFIIIVTQSGVFGNLIITKIPHDITPENADRMIFNISLEEVLLVTPSQRGIDGTAADSNTQQTTVDKIKSDRPDLFRGNL